MAARRFYRTVCKYLPTLMEMYKLDELTTMKTLQNSVKNIFYQNAHVKDLNKINVMVHKGDEELRLLLRMHKQRHHVVSKETTTRWTAVLDSDY
mmetsp:Transcript_4302/g.12624  ORF Transcript_4302/g.12624 Transcript_4302/m.12624 type:complete len:94 (-) Transcript_4302:1144-1425(-)